MNKLKWNKEFALEQAADDKELLEELIGIFKDSCVSDFRSVKEGLAAADANKICAAAHSIKGAAASLGIEGIRDVASAIEIDSRKGSVIVAQEQVEELGELLELLQEL